MAASGDITATRSGTTRLTVNSTGAAITGDVDITSTGYISLPSGTTAQRPGSPSAGYTRYNSTLGSIEFYNGSTWITTNLIPSITSITGQIKTGIATSLTIALTNATETVDVLFKEGATLISTVSNQSVSSGSLTVAVPSAVYNQSADDTITISVTNSDGTPSSNSQNLTVVGLPTGGTISTSGNYRYHVFTSSKSGADGFVTPSGFTSTVDYLIVAGGGGGGNNRGGGGGGGGLRQSTFTTSASTQYAVVVGAGGTNAGDGGDSSVFSITSTGGGGMNRSGGSGGGGSAGTAGGSGTTGQGNNGGNGTGTGSGGSGAGGGGGGQSAAGNNGSSNTLSGAGGEGWTITSGWSSLSVFSGMTVLSSGGGGASPFNSTVSPGGTGAGSGGTGTSDATQGRGTNGVSYGSGSGGGAYAGGYDDGTYFTTGKQGIVVIRYQL